MEFVHDPYNLEETIAAIATPPGEGGVAIIRISGKNAETIGEQMFSRPLSKIASHKATYGHVTHENGKRIDDALILIMRPPYSYTGELTVEIHCHGGALISKRVLSRTLELGAKSARPGEFTYRAFLNGKMDLTQAEAVQELIGAKNTFALDIAEKQLEGGLSKKIKRLQSDLTQIYAILEAWVDFPEEGLEFAPLEEVIRQLETAHQELSHLIHTYHDGKIAHEGVALCLIGAPNVGKSSLMNALLEKERAIVTHLPGTTRDIIEEQFKLNGLNIRLIDTAGIRETAEMIEQEGIRRSKIALSEADVVLFVIDGSKGIGEEEWHLIPLLPKSKTVVIWNKSDLPQCMPPSLPFQPLIQISAKELRGIDQLKQAIETVIWEDGPPSKEEILLTNVRHLEALKEAQHATEEVITGLKQSLSPEFLSQSMREILHSLGKIIGTNIGEDLLDAIFSKFCIGK